MKFVYRTDRGKVRNHNEDHVGIFFNQSNQILAVVADGMGGHLAGDVASKMATDILKKFWIEKDQIESPEAAEHWFKENVYKINEEIFQYANEIRNVKGWVRR